MAAIVSSPFNNKAPRPHPLNRMHHCDPSFPPVPLTSSAAAIFTPRLTGSYTSYVCCMAVRTIKTVRMRGVRPSTRSCMMPKMASAGVSAQSQASNRGLGGTGFGIRAWDQGLGSGSGLQAYLRKVKLSGCGGAGWGSRVRDQGLGSNLVGRRKMANK